MGNGGSRPEQHVFNADAPVTFSQTVLDSLQRTTETDGTRARDLELKIQARVNSELTRLRDEQAEQLEGLTARLTTDARSELVDATPPEFQHDPNSLAAHLSSPFYHDDNAKPAVEPEKAAGKSERTYESVQKEIMDLKAKLETRKKLERPSPEVEKAKESLVQCLRVNDRRPLDCWQEVEQFKVEVGKLEKAFVDKVGR